MVIHFVSVCVCSFSIYCWVGQGFGYSLDNVRTPRIYNHKN